MSDMMAQEDAINMSNEQAVQILIPMRTMMCDQYGCPISDAVFALDKAIKALSADRPSAVDLSSVYSTAYKSGYEKGKADRPSGEWIGEGDGYADGGIVYDIWYCSNCDHCEEGDELALPNFCPNCGARMKGADDE